MGQDWGTVATGLILIGGTIIDPIPLDEVVGIPLGMKLIADGLQGKDVSTSLQPL